jgi:hypothetical protein
MGRGGGGGGGGGLFSIFKTCLLTKNHWILTEHQRNHGINGVKIHIFFEDFFAINSE